MIAVDVETYDPDLLTKGPGPRRDGKMVGLCIGTDDGRSWYFPFGHEVEPHLNLDRDAVLHWAKDELCRANQPKVGANLSYDLDYLLAADIDVAGSLYDVQIAAPLLDENRRSYSLDSLSQDYLGEGKVKGALQEWVGRAYQDGNYRKHVWHTSPRLVGPYGEGDADLPIRLMKKFVPMLREQGLMDLFSIESRLIMPLLKMRQRGVRVDLVAAQLMDDELSERIELAQEMLNAAAGGPIDVDVNADLKRLFDREGVEYPLTEKGNPSFGKEWLMYHPHPACKLIIEVRKLLKYRDTFVRGYIFGMQINGRIHGQFHQLKGDENGTVSGRLSSSLPNLQNIPARDPEWGPRIRALFIPEGGEEWVRHDWSQIEYRFLAHYAQGKGADIIRDRYGADPETDYHEMTLDLVAPAAGWDISTPPLRKQRRKPVKNINFGLAYGMGENKLAADLGLDHAAAADLFSAYHSAVPFVKHTYNLASNRAKDAGFIKTILGRRARFELWQDARKWNSVGVARDEALTRYGPDIVRAYTHKALNRLLQGSAADMMKVAMVKIHESGVPSVLGCPLLTVHDELDHSAPTSAAGREAVAEVKHIMETCLPLKVPVIADEESGPNWGQVK
jgi:DNA polymerase I-like protein with 3'-5' exonuclease and polymerase domains